jgi:hypothetical protein
MHRSTLSLIACGLLLAGCQASAERPSRPQLQPESCSYAAVDFIRYYETLEALVDDSQEVLIGKVVDERVGPRREVAVDAASQARTLTVTVERALKGSPPQRFELATGGWQFDGGGARHSFDCPFFDVGDRVFLALGPSSDGERGGLSAVSEYRLVGGQVGDTERSEQLARSVEAMSEPELVAAVQELAGG